MGNKKNKQLFVIIILLAVSCFVVYGTRGGSHVVKKEGLAAAVGKIPGYKLEGVDPLDDNIISVLELDDYANNRYRKDNHTIGLYIGYYFSMDKVSAAHSPLVCFPGQGWKLDKIDRKSLQFPDGAINYEEFVAKHGTQQVLIMYWYQAGRKTTPQVYKNKINSAVNLLKERMQEHAFVRVSVPLSKIDKSEARSIGMDFIKFFYPVFLKYIDNDDS